MRSFPQLKGQGVNCFGEDAAQRVWFGVDGGALRYDGFRWQKFGPESGISSGVTSLARVDETFFAATRSAIYRFDRDAFEQVFPLDDQHHWVIEDLASNGDGGLWAATNWGAILLKGLRTTPGQPEWQQITLLCTDEIAKRFRERDQGVEIDTFVVSEPEFRPWKSGAGICILSSDEQRNVVIAIAEDGPAARHGIEIGDRITSINGEQRGSVFQRELQGPKGTPLQLEVDRMGEKKPISVNLQFESLEGSYPLFRPFRVVEQSGGKVWFATRLGQIFSVSGYQDPQPRWTNHTRDHDLQPVGMPSIALTQKGLAAVGRNTANRNLLKFDGDEWTSTELTRGIGSSILPLDNSKVLVGTNGAVLSIEPTGRAVDHPMQPYGIFGNDVFIHRTSDQALWILGEGSIALRVEPQDTWTSFDGLDFQDVGPGSVEWFISDGLAVVAREEDQWRAYDTSHGLMSAPLRVVATKSGDVWAAGSHNGVAATARFDGEKWIRKLHPDLSWGIDRRAVFEDRDGRLWFGAAVNQQVEEGDRGGVIRYDGQEWKHFRPTNRLDFVYGIAQTEDGSVWFAGPSLVRIRPDDTFGVPTDLPAVLRGFSDSLANDEQGNLWVGTRADGLVKLSGDGTDRFPFTTEVFDESTQLSSNRIKSISILSDGSILVGTPAGFDRFDGASWAPAALPSALAFGTDYSGVREGRDHDMWLNSVGLGQVSRDLAQLAENDLSDSKRRIRTHRFRRDSQAPQTRIDSHPSRTLHGNEVTVGWSGTDFLDTTPKEELTFSWRVGDRPWSPFQAIGQISLRDLDVGEHRIQVRARDSDFNVDTTSAESTLEVLPVLYQRAWFQGLLLLTGVLVIIGVVQTFRVFRSESSFRISNQKLLAAEHELRETNTSLEKRVSLRTSELKDANEQLHQSEVKYRSIVEDQSEYIVRFDADRNPTFMNEAFRRTLDDTNGRSTQSLSNDTDQRLAQLVTNLHATASTRPVTVRHESTNGNTRWEQWQCRALFDNSGSLLGYQAVGADVTELREAEDRLNEKEQQLAHLARVSALGEMVAGISHEINQPLASITNFSAASLMMLDRDSDGVGKNESRENVREWIQRIKEQADRINDIIKSLRRFGRPGSKLESFEITQAIDEAKALCESRTRGVVDEIVVQVPPTLPKVYADRIQIEQVLVNLIRNSCDAMDTANVSERHLRISGTADDGCVKIAVTDSGPGVLSGQTDDIFRPFVTTKPEGMGIGLAISRSIIESHGGTLRAIEDSHGGRFEFTLPTSKAQRQTQQPDEQF